MGTKGLTKKKKEEIAVKMDIISGKVKDSIEKAERYGISPKRYGELFKQLIKEGLLHD